MTEKDDHLQNRRQGAPLHAPLRFFTALILQSGIIYYFTRGGALEANDYDFHTGFGEFLSALTPAITILFLLPVIIRGSFIQRLIAIVLSICPAWIGFYGWAAVVGGLSK